MDFEATVIAYIKNFKTYFNFQLIIHVNFGIILYFWINLLIKGVVLLGPVKVRSNK